MLNPRWFRIVGDSVFLAGVAALAWFFFGLLTGWSYEEEHPAAEPGSAPRLGSN